MNYHLCFDIDGTLLSTGGAGGRSFKKAICKLFGKEPEWKKITMAGQLDIGIFKSILEHIGEDFNQAVWESFKAEYLAFFEIEKKDTSKWVVFDGVREILELTKSFSEKPILLTGNILEGALFKLQSVGLDTYFNWDASVFGEDGNRYRDELADAYHRKNTTEKIPVIIGDTPGDIRVGKLLKGISVAVSTGMHKNHELKEHAPDYILSSMKEFPESLLLKNAG